MNKERWQQVTSIVDKVLDLDMDAAGRYAFVEAECGGDTQLQAEVLDFLRAVTTSERFWEEMLESGQALVNELTTSGEDTGINQSLYRIKQAGPYKVLKLIARGGMSNVYLAERNDGFFQRYVAIKILRRELNSEHHIKLFLAEREILSSLEHPNIARLYDAGIADGRPYLVMEYVEGMPLTSYCADNNCSFETRIELFKQVCQAVKTAHRNLIVHRDLKPDNILVTPDGTVKILDFGIAKIIDTEPEHKPDPEAESEPGPGQEVVEQTEKGPRMFSIQYAAPEQITHGRITTSTDVYALGMLLYELLAGQPPFYLTSKKLRDAEYIIRNQTADPPGSLVTDSALARKLKGDLDAITVKALQKDPARRYASADHMLNDVCRYQDGQPVSARPSTRRYRVRKFIIRHPGLMAVIAMAVLSATIYLVTQQRYAERLKAERDMAESAQERAESVTGFLMDLFDDAGSSGARDTLSVASLLALGEERLGADTTYHPLVRIGLLAALSRAYFRTGFDGAGLRINDVRIAAVREYYGPDDLNTATALIMAGIDRVDVRHWKPAAEMLEEGLAILRAHPQMGTGTGEYSKLLSLALRYLSITYRHLGQPVEALEAVEQYLELRAEQNKEGHREHMQSEDLAALAYILRGHGRYEEAAGLYEQAMAIGRTSGAGAHPVTLNNYASLLRAMGRPGEAEPLFRESRERRWPAPGEEPSMFLDNVNGNLMSLLNILGRDDEAIEIALEYLELLRTTHPSAHWRVGRAINGVGTAYMLAGDCVNAMPYLREGMENYEAGLGPDHTWTASVRASIGLCFNDMGRLHEAEEYLLEAHRSFLTSNEETNPADVVPTLRGLTMVYETLDRTDEAAHYRELLEQAQQTDR
jgi:eukaryotic-like serine/threonine-protein kinase